ncbi:MAG: MBL fold metallo-hydrolase [Sedimentisphaerales bacterium]|nr:MBL fold metallo-hydrolase [Sedimentisphaerales bacterium]
MDIKAFVLGDYQTNCFCVRKDDSAKDCLVMDPGLSPEPLIDHLKQNRLNPVAAVITHGHIDHIFGLRALKETFPDIKVAIHKDDAEALVDPLKNLSAMLGGSFITDPADIIIEKEEPIEFIGIKFEVFHTPGHSPGGICLYKKDENILFAGDTLFDGSVGRSDFPGGNSELLINSIKTKLLNLPDNTRVCTGHGPETTIGKEKQFNQFLRW